MKKLTLPTMKRIRKWPRNVSRFLGDHWWAILSICLVLAAISTLLGIKLMGLTGHRLSIQEYGLESHLLRRDLSLKIILRNPVNLPFTLGIYLLEKLHMTDPLALRSISVVFGAAAVGSFYLILKNWHTRRVALLGTILFATSAWSLHTSRLALPDVLLMMPMILILCATWLDTSRKRRWILTLCLVAALLLIYVPGMILFVGAGAAWQAKRIYFKLRQTPLWFVIPWLLLSVLLLIPLLVMIVTAPHNIPTLLGIPSKLPSPKQYLMNLINVPLHLYVKGPLDSARWLGRLPIIDIFSTLMVAVGIYAYAFRFRLDRTKLLAGIFTVGSLLIALGGGVTITFLIPFVYILAAGGITLMLQQWATVFPRNPFAKTLATTLMSIVVLFAAFYNINHYFIAWPNTPETHKIFIYK